MIDRISTLYQLQSLENLADPIISSDEVITNDGFKAPWWAKNRHLQTVWSSLFRRLPPLPPMIRKRIELIDGDFIDVDLTLRQTGPTLLLLHGLEGSIDSPYIRGMIDSADKRGWRVLVMHFRSCSGEPNRLLRSYNSGVSDDLEQVLTLLEKESISVDYIVGYSLGGNVLLKWLGEKGNKANIQAAAAVSVPLMLNICATEINRGFSRIYQASLLRTLRNKTREKVVQFGSVKLPKLNEIKKLTSFWLFDEQVTAPAHGFDSAMDYYNKVSSRQFIKHIRVPTLIIQSKDDPFMNATVLPDLDELPQVVSLEANEHGGHVGFVQGKWPWKASYYLESRIPNYLERFFNNG